MTAQQGDVLRQFFRSKCGLVWCVRNGTNGSGSGDGDGVDKDTIAGVD